MTPTTITRALAAGRLSDLELDAEHEDQQHNASLIDRLLDRWGSLVWGGPDDDEDEDDAELDDEDFDP